MPRTLPLIILLALSIIACVVSYGRFSKLRDDAETAALSLSKVKQDLADIDQLRRAGARPAAAALDAVELNNEIEAATQAAGLAKTPGADAMSSSRVGSSDYSQTPVALDFGPISLKQLITFLHHLSANDPSARIKMIELSSQLASRPGAAPPGVPLESLWLADVEVRFMTHNPLPANPQRP